MKLQLPHNTTTVGNSRDGFFANMLGRKKKSPSTEAALTEMALKIDWLIGAHIGLTCLWE